MDDLEIRCHKCDGPMPSSYDNFTPWVWGPRHPFCSQECLREWEHENGITFGRLDVLRALCPCETDGDGYRGCIQDDPDKPEIMRVCTAPFDGDLGQGAARFHCWERHDRDMERERQVALAMMGKLDGQGREGEAER